ncbi:UDP-N-acetylglucosamine 1-carboxyvinyltransferase [Kineothrix alysoides]|uniref:UDP-N-acetylglucosamine 1-carboxyvinyltransferase n=2 Tax=Kineothrix alysoides TaxID=1469948 RepID=A0A4R1R3R8_9FIRM|nr:UDP-N-acetylglucosamine 1-carboxyvinyltransferase [Kineothrix alysoides]
MYGGNFLRGEVKIQGSKNAVLPIMAAALLIKGTCVIKNCPRIADVYLMQNLLQELGCLVTWSENTVTIDASNVIDSAMSGESVSSMRSSVMLLGAMLGRIGEVFMAYPGGCVIGKRPIDLHLSALKEMGVEIMEQEHFFTAKVGRLKAMDYTLPFPSVGATENIILAAVLAEGTTTIRGAAKEPEITALCEFLRAAGADIEGAGEQTVVIKGVKELRETRYTVPGDRIVAGTYLIGALAAGGSIFLEKAPSEHMKALLKPAAQMGGTITINKGGVGIDVIRRLEAIPYLKTEVYDGFPTDLQSPIMAAMAVAHGDSVLEETIFENRFRIVDELRKMGADIRTEKNKAYISGIERLKGAVVEAEELRGGAALVVAGLEAEGETVIKNRHFIERGYEDICRDLRNLGADINIR